MDLITQAVLGAAIGQVGWRTKLGGGAVIAGACFGVLPDLDVAAALAGQWASLVHHRGISHALIFAPVICAPAGYLAWRANKRRGKWTQWAHLAFWAIWTHPMLDAFTVYGTQLALPFSNKRFAFDGISIIDPLYTIPLIVALILAQRWRQHPQRGQRITALALAWSTLYLGLGLWQNHRAKHWGQTQWHAQHKTDKKLVDLRATPTFANLLAWRIVARDDGNNIYIKRHSNLAMKPDGFITITPPIRDGQLDPLILKAKADERAQIFHWFADDYVSYTFTKQPNGQLKLRMGDQRYGGMMEPARAMWGADVIFDEQQNIVSIDRYRDRPKAIKKELGALKHLILTGDVPKK